MAEGFERQVRARQEYRRRNPSWLDSVSRYRALIGDVSHPGARILDLGAGATGCTATTSVRARRGGCRRRPGPWQRSPAIGCITHRVVGSGEDLPFTARAFDIVASAWVLEHLDHPGLVFSEVHRVLVARRHFRFPDPERVELQRVDDPGVPHRWHAGVTRRLYGRGEGDAYPVRYRANSRDRLHRLLNAAGFEHTELPTTATRRTSRSTGPCSKPRSVSSACSPRPAARGARAHPRRRPSMRPGSGD